MARRLKEDFDDKDFLRIPVVSTLFRQFPDFSGLASRNKHGLDIFLNCDMEVGVNTFMDRSFFVVGSSGSGKSGVIRVVLEELQRKKIPCVVFDSDGEYCSLLSMFPNIILMGGNNPDGSRRKPELDVEGAGRLAREALFKHKSFIFDLSADDDEIQVAFSAAFISALDGLARSQPLENCPDFLAVFIEEAQNLYPQSSDDSPNGAVKKDLVSLRRSITWLAKRGRKRHISLWLITQRPQAINKNALTQVSSIFALRLTHNLDYKAVGKQLGINEARCKELFPRLRNGQVFYNVWDMGIRRILQVRLSHSKHLARSANELGDYEMFLEKTKGEEDSDGS